MMLALSSPICPPLPDWSAALGQTILRPRPSAGKVSGRDELVLGAKPVRLRIAALLEVDEVGARRDVFPGDLDLLLACRPLHGRLARGRLRRFRHVRPFLGVVDGRFFSSPRATPFWANAI